MDSDNTLRQQVIRLAHSKPALRPHLLPLLREAAGPGPKWQQELLIELASARVDHKIPKAEGDKIRQAIIDADTAAEGRKALDGALVKHKTANMVRVYADLDERGLTVWCEFTPYGQPHFVMSQIKGAQQQLNAFSKQAQMQWPQGVWWRNFGDIFVDQLSGRRAVMYFHVSAQGAWDDAAQGDITGALLPVSGWKPLPK